jgi:hypothetical protein
VGSGPAVGGGPPGDGGEGGDAEGHGCVPAGDEPVDLGELGVGGGKADLESFGFAGPALLFGFGDAGGQVLADGGQPVPLGRVDAEQGTANAPLTELTRGPGLAPAGATASDRAGIRLLSAVIGHCG